MAIADTPWTAHAAAFLLCPNFLTSPICGLTQLAAWDGDSADAQTEKALTEYKQQSKLIFRRLTPNSEPACSIESGDYTLQ